jgi:D-alanyl-D-alanine carboxypeptidase
MRPIRRLSPARSGLRTPALSGLRTPALSGLRTPALSGLLGPALAGLVGIALLGAACSDDGSDTDDEGASTSTSAPADGGGGGLWSGPLPNDREMSEEDQAEIDAVVQAVMEETEGQVPGIWIGIWDSEKGSYLTAAGEAVLGGTAAEPDQVGRIGSVTNTFTATAMLREVGEGRASLDDRIEELLPDLAEEHPDVAAITVEELLGMASGIPDYANSDWFLPQVVENPSRVWEPAEIIDQVLSRGDLEPIGTPGYSTTNYLILGEMLEEVVEGDEDISEILDGVAEDAGLAGARMPEPEDAALPDPHSNGYVSEAGAESLAPTGAIIPPGTDVTDWSPSWGGAGGAMYAGLEDLGAWAGTGLGTALLSRETGDLRISETSELPGLGTYGLGLLDLGDGWIGHTGQIVGWETLAAYNTETGDVFVAIVNEAASVTAAVAVATEVYPELGEALI